MIMTEPVAHAADEQALAGFGRATRTWFTDVFAAPTAVQAATWQTVSTGRNALVIAPTGSGKTLAAFLQSIDRLATAPKTSDTTQDDSATPSGVRILYISPLKALAVDIERNLQAPLRGIITTAQRLGLPEPHISVAVRSGDTSAAQRRRIASHPPDILITTPESLFLMLSSQATETLRDVETVIVDEVHALAGTKRGAHLMVSLERVAALSRHGGFQRIGLSATVRPPEKVAAFLSGDRPVTVVSPPAVKTWDLSVVVPVEDMTQPDADDGPEDTTNGPARQPSMWPPIERRILDLIGTHRSTICFVNSRRVAERLTAHLNELHAHDLGAVDAPQELPAEVMVASAASKGRDGSEFPIVASAHHGSVSKQRRAQIEQDLKSGALPCVVATSSLELGIDMGAVDLVIQVQAPPSVSSGLQRVGRAGHQVGAISQGVLFPTARGDMLESAVVAGRMATGHIEAVHQLHNPLDVLAQQLVSMCVNDSHSSAELFGLVRHCDPFIDLPRSVFDGVLDMLTGRYPSEDFAELRPRLVWDRSTDVVTARPGARRLVTTSGGTIPDRGLFGVFLIGEQTAAGRHVPGRRVGELDEEMVYESRVGDVFTLGTSSWRIEDITHSQVLVSPAPGRPGRLPFWRGDSPARPAELGRAIGARVRELGEAGYQQALVELTDEGLDNLASKNLMAYLDEQREATGQLPTDRTIVVERFRDEIGDWRICVHCQLGAAVLQPWGLVIEKLARERTGVDVHVTALNDGLIIQLPDVDSELVLSELLVIDADEIESLVTQQVFGSALFAARFRECAARALLLPRRNPGTRAPLWQQRIKSAQLLAVAAGYRDFPIVVEAMRECLQDVFDLPGLRSLMADIAARRIRLVEVETQQPSPFARNLLFGYVGEFVYDSDQPLAERKLAALGLDSGMLAELLGTSGAPQLLDPEVIDEIQARLQRLAPDYRARDAEGLWEIIRTIGPLTTQECRSRGVRPEVPSQPDEAASPSDEWLTALARAHRIAPVRINGTDMWCADADTGLLRDALGIPVPAAMSAPATRDQTAAVRDLVLRWVRHHAVSTTDELTRRYGLARAAADTALTALVADGTVLKGHFTTDSGPEAPEYCHQQVLTLIKRRSLARLRNQVEAVDQQQFARFLDAWQQLPTHADHPTGHEGEPGNATMEDLLAVVDLLAGYPIPASMLESVVLPSRLPGYRPALLDEALSTGELIWTGSRALGRRDGWIILKPADIEVPRAPITEATSDKHPTSTDSDLSPLARQLATRLEAGGGWRIDELTDPQHGPSAVTDALWELAWCGRVTTDTFGPVRELSSGRGTLKTPSTPRVRRRAVRPRAPRPMMVGGTRWAAMPVTPPSGGTGQPDPKAKASSLLQALELELGRYGILTRGSLLTEPSTPNFAEAYRVLTQMEELGNTRRGYFVEGLGGAQFATPGAVDLLRSAPPTPQRLLAACDPVNPYGAALEWPPTNGHRPTRKAGALVVLDDGLPIIYVERGAHTLLTFEQADENRLAAALMTLAAAIDHGRLGTITIDRMNGRPALETGTAGMDTADAGTVGIDVSGASPESTQTSQGVTSSELARALREAGFVMVPRGYTRRRRR